MSTTALLIFGLLTFWIYTVQRYYAIVHRHLHVRLHGFANRLAPATLSPENRDFLTTITEKGFRCSNTTKWACTCLYAASALLMVALAVHKYFTGNVHYMMDLGVVGGAALLFCSSGVYFLASVCKTLKSHEYYELLLFRLAQDAGSFRMVQPSSSFVKRWDRIQNWIALFLVLSVPMTISPCVAVYHFYAALEAAGDWVDVVSIVWVAVVLICAAVFHLWGSSILITMYNSHLRIEAINRQALAGPAPWCSEETDEGRLAFPNDPDVSEDTVVPERMLAAIMITDMVGYSREMEGHEDEAYQKLVRHNEIIRRHLSRNHGEEMKTMGDAFLVRFKSAVDAVRAAMNIQRELSEHNRGKPEIEQILVRIGIHIGDVMIVGRDVLGSGVNVAARIEPIAEPGGICISADIYNIVKKSIDLKAVSLGRKELKNIQDAPELYKILVQSVTTPDRDV